MINYLKHLAAEIDIVNFIFRNIVYLNQIREDCAGALQVSLYYSVINGDLALKSKFYNTKIARLRIRNEFKHRSIEDWQLKRQSHIASRSSTTIEKLATATRLN